LEEWAPIPKARRTEKQLTRQHARQNLRLDVTAKNLEGETTATSSATEQVQGLAANVEPPSISGEAAEGELLTANPGVWTGWPLPYAYQWERSDPAREWIPIAKESTYRLSREDVGREVRVTVSVGDVQARSAPTDTVKGSPTNQEPPSISGEAAEGELLTANPGVWTGWPLPYAYQWERSDPAREWIPIAKE